MYKFYAWHLIILYVLKLRRRTNAPHTHIVNAVCYFSFLFVPLLFEYFAVIEWMFKYSIFFVFIIISLPAHTKRIFIVKKPPNASQERKIDYYYILYALDNKNAVFSFFECACLNALAQIRIQVNDDSICRNRAFKSTKNVFVFFFEQWKEHKANEFVYL